jgi:hypothetical protein
VSAFTADLILRYMEKIKSFDFDKKLHNIKSATIPLEKFLPENLTMLFLAIMVGGATGSLYDLAGLPWYFSLPCASAGGLAVCFAVQYMAENIINRIMENNLPGGENAAGLDGYCIEPIEIGGWGKVIFFHKDREFTVNAVNSAESEIQEGIKVISLYEKDGFYFVIRTDEVHKNVDKDN